MKHFKTFVATLAAVALTGAVAVAQNAPPATSGAAPAPSGSMPSDSMQSGSMSKGSMSSMKMSKSDMSTMKSCQAMSHDAMMGNSKCKSFMAAHPDMFNADGTMKPQ